MTKLPPYLFYCKRIRKSEGKIFHFDLYRLRNLEEVYDIGIEDYLDNAFLSIIEWPEIFQDEISDLPHHEMEITNSDNIRTIKFK